MNVKERYNEVEIFNLVAGNLQNVDAASLDAQIKVVVEEVKELKDAFAEKDAVGLLDGVCDAFVTVAGLMQKMEKAGFKVDEALKRVCDNNVTKFPRILDVDYRDRGWDAEYNEAYGCFVLKDFNGKVRKPDGFVSVEISDLVPEGFFGGAA